MRRQAHECMLGLAECIYCTSLSPGEWKAAIPGITIFTKSGLSIPFLFLIFFSWAVFTLIAYPKYMHISTFNCLFPDDYLFSCM